MKEVRLVVCLCGRLGSMVVCDVVVEWWWCGRLALVCTVKRSGCRLGSLMPFGFAGGAAVVL